VDIVGFGNAKLSLRTTGDAKDWNQIDARVLAHGKGWWGAQAGMVVGTASVHPVSFCAGGKLKMSVTPNGVVVPSPFTVQGGGSGASFEGNVTAAALTVNGDLAIGQKLRSPMFQVTQFFKDVRDPGAVAPMSMPYGGGTLLLFVSGTASCPFGQSDVGVDVIVDGSIRGSVWSRADVPGQVPFSGILVLSGIKKTMSQGYLLWVRGKDNTRFDPNSSIFNMVGVELPI
jgi:hypothetical protein